MRDQESVNNITFLLSDNREDSTEDRKNQADCLPMASGRKRKGARYLPWLFGIDRRLQGDSIVHAGGTGISNIPFTLNDEARSIFI
jgi:hypothetical protein